MRGRDLSGCTLLPASFSVGPSSHLQHAETKMRRPSDVDDRGHLLSFLSLVKFACCLYFFFLSVSRMAL